MLPSLSVDARLARITLRDPARRNALDLGALDTLRTHLERLSNEPAADALLLAGEGTAFCAGFDLAACAEDPRRVEPLLIGLSACVQALRALDIPVVARVQGAALAGGCALLTGCDFVVVARDAQLGYPTHRIGISPAVSIPSLLSRMGPAARSLLVSNDLIDGDAAHARGLATHVAEAADLDAEVEALVARLTGAKRVSTQGWMIRTSGDISARVQEKVEGYVHSGGIQPPAELRGSVISGGSTGVWPSARKYMRLRNSYG
jgi:enoyl-CoA hydratase/carnithine racemase